MTSIPFVPRDVEDVPFWPSLIPVQSKAPPASSRVWLDTSTQPAVFKAWDGAGWAPVAGADAPADVAIADAVGGTGTLTRAALNAAYVARLGTRGATRTIYVRATGDDTTGDGKTAGTAYREVRKAVDSLAGDGPVVRGSVVIDVGAGTYKGGIRLPLTRGRSQDDFIKIIGPAVGGHPNVPTAVIDYAADTSVTWGLLAEDGAAIWLEGIKFVGGFPIAVRAERNVYLQWRNTHVDGQGVGSVGLAPNTHVRYYVTGGIIENLTTNGIQELFHVTRAFNTVASNAEQMIIRNCDEVGFQAKENCVGHLDYLNVEDCATGIEFNGYCVTNVKSVSLKRNTLGIANVNSEVHNEDGIAWGTGADANTRELFTAGSGTELSVWGWVDSSTALTSKVGHRPLVTIGASYADATVTGVTAETSFYSLASIVRPHRYNVAGKRLRIVAWGSVNTAVTTATGFRILLRFGTTLIGEARIPQTAVVGDDFRIEFDIVCSADGNTQKVMAACLGYPNAPTNYATRTFDMSQAGSFTVNLFGIPAATSESVTMRLIEVWG